MRIAASNIQLSSAHLFQAQHAVKDQLAVRIQPVNGEDSFRREGPSVRHDTERLVKLLKRYFERAERGENTERLEAKIDRLVKRIEAADKEGSEQRFRIDLKYRHQETYREVEATSFRAAGSVTTTDGRKIDFAQALDLARAYARTETISLKASAVVPIGSGSAPAQPALPDSTQTPTPIAAPAGRQGLAIGGGVLGYDQNGDGAIDPSSELIGGTGNGFAELSRYDQDGNGFIDEGDEIFSKLSIVSAGTEGPTALRDKGVGAIYLDSVATPYTERDSGGQVTAQLARSGVYLNEDGSTGLAQQVNVLA